MTLASLFAIGALAVGQLHIQDVRQDRPEFQRVYTQKLDERATLIITAKWFIGDVFITGELRQPGGRYVTFQLDEIAEKIIDPMLVPLVQQAVRNILKIDKEWRASRPNSFIDEAGDHWVRAK